MMKDILVFSIVLVSILPGCQGSKGLFVPDEFVVPESYVSGNLLFKQLRREIADLDYEAVMESKEALRAQFEGGWPADDFSLADNIRDIEEHEVLFLKRTSFAYSILTDSGERVLGCLYINPIEDSMYGAQVHLWVRSSEKEKAAIIRGAMKRWLHEQWPFGEVKYWP